MNEPSLDTIHQILFGASKALVLKTALELDLFTVIAGGVSDAVAIAKATECHPDGIRALLDALIPLEFLQRHNHGYELTPVSAAFLVRNRPSFYGDSYLDALLPWAWGDTSKLRAALRNHRGAGKDITDDTAVALWRSWCEAHAVMRNGILIDARQMWNGIRQRVSLPRAPEVLDVACGHALWTMALAQLDEGTRITALDRYEEILAVAHRLSADLHLENRFRTVQGDIRDFNTHGRNFEIVYIGGILYLFSQEDIRAILRRVSAVIRPNGLVVLNTMIVDEERSSSTAPLIQSFRRFLYNGGRVPTIREYERAIEDAGFKGTVQIGDSILVARYPGNQ